MTNLTDLQNSLIHQRLLCLNHFQFGIQADQKKLSCIEDVDASDKDALVATEFG